MKNAKWVSLSAPPGNIQKFAWVVFCSLIAYLLVLGVGPLWEFLGFPGLQRICVRGSFVQNRDQLVEAGNEQIRQVHAC